ncbi:Ig-like domain-containing protein, partial [Methanobrevibacter sp.]|uniref:Ig-like domain-containing protein n=1 Tax=Methanobrevibacter sp. TaxID=66852 RepID=UPI00386EC96D
DNLDDEDGEFYELHLSDLGITETDEYDILVEFTKNGELLVYNNRALAVGMVNIRSHEEDDEGGLATFDSIDMLVFNIKVNENVTGFARLSVNGNLVGDRISFADLRYSTHAPDDGRQIVLNDLNIGESGQYQVRIEVYDENDEILADKDIELLVEVGEDSVSFEDGGYGCEAFDVIRFSIGTPLSAGQCYNIYFNGKKAGNFTANGIVIFDEYLDEIFDVKLMKGGDYDVNVTFFDGENEIPFDTGSFSIEQLELSRDKDVYLFGIDDTLVSFKLDYPVEGARLDAYYLYNWGPQGMDGDMLFNPFIDDGILELVKDGVLTFEAAWSMAGSYNFEVGTNYIYVTYRYDNDGDDYLYQFGGIIAIEVVEPVDPELTITVTNVSQGTDAVITITTNETFTGNVTVYIGNGVYEVAVVNGKGTRNLSTVLDVVPGTYDAEAKFKATGLFESSSKTAKFTVTSKPSEMDPNLTISVADITEGASAVVKITTQTTFSGTVTVQIANRNYTVPVSNGAGSISVPGLAVGSYTATAFFAATDKFDASIKATTFKVNKKPDVIKLALKKVKVKKSAKKVILKATLKINGKAVKGLVVTFKFNKKTLKAKTNKKGVAKAKVNKKVLKKLKVGKKVKVKAIYGNAVAKKTAKVKK